MKVSLQVVFWGCLGCRDPRCAAVLIEIATVPSVGRREAHGNTVRFYSPSEELMHSYALRPLRP